MILKKGTYRFNGDVDTSEMDGAVGELDFVSNGEAFYQIILSYYQNHVVSYRLANDYDAIIVYNNGWNTNYQTVSLSEDQNVDDEFGVWFIANTNYNQINAPITFNITENAEFTLATKGKYCDKDIAVNVAVPDERCFEVIGDTLVANCATIDGDTLVITPIEDKTLIL